MNTYDAPGLTANWLNGWLAAIGVTVLVEGVRLAWSNDAVPHARFEGATGTILDEIASKLPCEETLAQSVIARNLAGAEHPFPRNVSIEAYLERVRIERSVRQGMLAASVTDLRAEVDPKSLDHGAFDPAAPRGETLWSRAVACARAVPDDERADMLAATLAGRGVRKQLNGLGFDCRRLPAGVHATGAISKIFADPVIELLCWEALRMFPTRGNGKRVRQRGWSERSTRRGAFVWFAWKPFLDRWAIDALLDLDDSARRRFLIEAYRSVPYQPGGTADPTRAYFGERIP